MIDRRTLLAALPAIPLTVARTASATASAPWRPLPQYVQPTTRLVPARGGLNLTSGWTGTKVSLVQRALGLGSRFEVYDATTRARVIAFQRRRRLPATGVVDARTWGALRTGQPWTIDAWRPAIAVAPDASRVARIEAMIRYALAQQGSPYTWGGAGPKALGHDCSGLVLAALAAAGVDPQPITVNRHQSPGYLTTEAIYRAPFEHVPLAARQRGDLIFWFGPNGRTAHVAIYLGAGRMVEASSGSGVTKLSPYRGSYSRRTIAPTVVRPFTARVR